MSRSLTTVSDEEIQAWVNGELPDAELERVRGAVLTDPRATAVFDECLQLRAVGHHLRDADEEHPLEAQSDVHKLTRCNLRAV